MNIKVTYGGKTSTYLPGSKITIGRSRDCAVVVESPSVSRAHAYLEVSDGGWVIHDTSTTGTFLNRTKVTRAPINGRTEVRLGSAGGPSVVIEPVTAEQPVKKQPQKSPAVSETEPQDVMSALKLLVPIRSWLDNPGWTKWWRLIVIPYALLPLIFLDLFKNSSNLTTPGWIYCLYIAPLWFAVFYYLIRPGHIGALEVGIGAVCIVGVMFLIKVATIPINGHLRPSSTIFEGLGIGYNEELTKALPLLGVGLYLLLVQKKKLDVRMWMMLGATCGLAFGVYEASTLYTARDLSEIIALGPQYGNQVGVVAQLAFCERIFLDGFQHAMWAGISGFFVGLALNYRKQALPILALGISIPAFLHGLNDWNFGSKTGLLFPVLVQAASVLMFIGYTMSAKDIEDRVRRTRVFRREESLAIEAIGNQPADGKG